MTPAGGRAGLTALLVLSGATWGLGVPFWKMAASTGHDALGLTVWQLVYAVLFLAPVLGLRRTPVPLTRDALVLYAGLALFGTLLPNITYYMAIERLPAGIMAITVATVPMITLLIATMIGMDRPSAVRLGGVALGLVAVLLLSLPDSLPAPGLVPFVLLGLLTAFLYACESNWVAARHVPGLDPVAAIFAASVLALLVALPAALASGRFVDLAVPWGEAEWALLAGSALNVVAYTLYVGLVARAGAVFAAQSGYVVTVAGVLASLLILGERYSGPVWLALLLVLAGLALVRPRQPPRATA
jgi:drug/metabolite transporter (DMT)-like permease